jgi:AAA domain
VDVPTSRIELIQQKRLVEERLENAGELQNVQNKFREVSDNITQLEQESHERQLELTALSRIFANPPEDFYGYFHKKYHQKHQELFKLSQQFLTQKALHQKDIVQPSLELYLNFLSENGWKTTNKIKENLAEHIKALSLLFPVITTSLLSVRNMLPWLEECIDRTIVDEAGMIPQHQTFPLLVRSRKAIIVGDPLQIEPVITLTKATREHYCQTAFIDRGLKENDYQKYSPEEEYRATTYHRAAGASGEDNDKGQGICLIEHFRCQPSIIQYCNNIANYGLDIKTEQKTSALGTNLIAYHVEGSISAKVNQEEVTAICELIKHLKTQGYSLTEDIGVISAFRPQANALSEALRKQFPELGQEKEVIGTVHTFQGSEKKVIIFSTTVCRPQDNNKANWINKRPNLLNVAVSRAKELFILVGNLYRLEQAGSYTSQLVEHIRENGLIFEYKSEAEIPHSEPGSVQIYDCDHLNIFKEALEQVEQELIIITPWIRGNESKRFMDDIVLPLEKGVKVTVVYGNKGNEENDNNDAQTEKELQELFAQYPGSRVIRLGREIYIESRGTNEKILVCDTKFAVVGSWNWLSHPYRRQCSRSSINPKAQIRREMSIKLSDSLSIADVKARVYQLITQ